MKTKIQQEVEVDLRILKVHANVRYWEDASVDGVDDEEGNLIPCRKGECWCPEIDIETGQILNWDKGKTASIHYKVCDEGVYTVIDDNERDVLEIEGYVPETMCPKGSGYGDYIIMDIN